MVARLRQFLCLAALAVAVPAVAVAEDLSVLCKGNPEVVDACRIIHGRLTLSGDDGFLLWPVGTKRLMRVRGKHDFPESMYPIFTADLFAVVFGDYEVCPFEKDRPGWRRSVCIESASHLVIVGSQAK